MSRAASREYFDGWYAAKLRAPQVDDAHRRHLALPAHVLSTSLLTGDGLAEVARRLDLAPGATLVDLACGRGGYGLELAARLGVRLVGVDFSAEAIRQATELAASLGRDADFVVGDLAATGLPDAAADAVLCVDAIQFADPPSAAYREIARILRPSGRAVLTCWEARDRDDERVVERLRRVDLAGGLRDAGLTDVDVLERPAWRAAERALFEEGVALDPGKDTAQRSFHDEAVRVLATFDLVRRVLATARTAG